MKSLREIQVETIISHFDDIPCFDWKYTGEYRDAIKKGLDESEQLFPAPDVNKAFRDAMKGKVE